MRTSKLLACRNLVVRRSELQDIVARFHTFKFQCSSVRIDTIIFSTIILSFIAMLQWIPLCSQCMKLNSAMVGQNKGILMRVICLAQVVTLYIYINHEETMKVFLRKQYEVSKENMRKPLLLHEENTRYSKYESYNETNSNTCLSHRKHEMNTCRI